MDAALHRDWSNEKRDTLAHFEGVFKWSHTCHEAMTIGISLERKK